jgi:hypothetical protein
MREDAGGLRDQLKEAVTRAVQLSWELESLVAEKSSSPDGGFHGKLSHSQPPWNAAYAHLITDLHALARDMERSFRVRAGQPVRGRGGSDANTIRALGAVIALAEAVDDTHVAKAVSQLERWSQRTREAMGEADRPRRLPREPNGSEPRCPWCERTTLRWWGLYGKVRCLNYACRDGDGNRPVAAMEYSEVASDWVLVWADGSVGAPS